MKTSKGRGRASWLDIATPETSRGESDRQEELKRAGKQEKLRECSGVGFFLGGYFLGGGWGGGVILFLKARLKYFHPK